MNSGTMQPNIVQVEVEGIEAPDVLALYRFQAQIIFCVNDGMHHDFNVRAKTFGRAPFSYLNPNG